MSRYLVRVRQTQDYEIEINDSLDRGPEWAKDRATEYIDTTVKRQYQRFALVDSETTALEAVDLDTAKVW